MSNKSMDHKFLLFLCRSRSFPPDSGLSMLEVLVAMMVVFLTFMTSLNGLLYATLFQVKADRQAKAVYWIQQDVENVKSFAASYTTPTTNGCQNSTIGTDFRDSNLPPVLLSEQPLFGKQYEIIRDPNPSDNVLQINYTVREKDNASNILATLYTEILPAAALSCS
ncbi:MAG: type II secretion system protein [Snowella sp.]|nr:type II secretion system protein [Snowella sp.]